MRNLRISGLCGFLALGVFAAFISPGLAQDTFPSRVVKIVVPAAGGSTTDTLARVVADKLSQKWGKSAIVENIAGGAMNIGASNVARAAPDGYTLMVAPPSPLSVQRSSVQGPRATPRRSSCRSRCWRRFPNVLVVRNDLPVTTVKELIAYGKANPDKLSYASQGAGSTAHLTASQLEVLGGIKMVHVPYRGAQPALTDVIAGHVDMFFDTPTTSVPLYRDGKVKMLGVADTKRLTRRARSADHLRGGAARLPLHHLVRTGGTAANPRGARR